MAKQKQALQIAAPTNDAELIAQEGINFLADAGMTPEFVATDLAIPFLVILQKNSPQVDEDSGKYIEGAKAGMIYNTVTGDLFDGKTEGISVVPAGYQKKFVEWVSRDEGGGFVAQHDPDSDAVKRCVVNEKKLETENGHQMVETAYHYVILRNGSSLEWAVIGMSSTQLKKSRRWNTIMGGLSMTTPDGRSFKPPIFAHTYRLKTVLEQKDTNTWYGWDISIEGVVNEKRVYEAGKRYFNALAQGTVRVGAPPSDNDNDDSSNVF